MEETLLIIKPDAVAQRFNGRIIRRIQQEGFKILKSKSIKLSEEEAGDFYIVHKGKPFYSELINFITSGKIIVMRLAREEAVKHLRKIVGATNPLNAAQGTIRSEFGTSVCVNAVHASDSNENAKREIAFFFK